MAHENTALFHLKGVLAHISVKEIKVDLTGMLKRYTTPTQVKRLMPPTT